MFSVSKIVVGLGLSLCLTTPVFAADLAREVAKRGTVHWVDSEFSTDISSLSFGELKQRIQDVADKPCELAIARNVSTNPKKGILGFLTGAIGLKTAVELDAGVEDSGGSTGYLTKPANSTEWKKWVDYLENVTSTDGSDDLKTALILRRKSRILKFQFWLEDFLKKDFNTITETDMDWSEWPLSRGKSRLEIMVNDIFEPVTIILKPELAKVLLMDVIKTGPAFGAVPTLNLISDSEIDGRQKTVNGCIVDKNGAFIVRRTDSVILLSDIRGVMSIDSTIGDDSLGTIVGHELFHGIMSDVMDKYGPSRYSKSEVGHDAHIISDDFMAFSEGWAEFFEAWTGEDNEVLDNSGGKSKVSRFLIGRQLPIRQGLYTQVDFEKFRSTKKNGSIKSGSQMQATEGLVAGIIYKIMTHKDVNDSFALAIENFYKEHPQTLTQFVQGMIDTTTDRKAKRAIALTFLHETKFATVSAEAKRLYELMFSAKLKFVRGKNDGANDDESAVLRAAFSAARKNYRDFVSSLEREVLSGSLALDANIGKELWFEGAAKYTTRYETAFTFNLNTVTLPFLKSITLDKFGSEIAGEIIEARDALGCLESEEDLSRHISDKAMSFLTSIKKIYVPTHKR